MNPFITEKNSQRYPYDVHPLGVMPFSPVFDALKNVHIAKIFMINKRAPIKLRVFPVTGHAVFVD
jgi:hypothetical protein